MVFTSVPLYLDPPNNWPQQQAQQQQQQTNHHHQHQHQHQHQHLHQGIISSNNNGNHPQQLPLPTTQPPAQAAGNTGAGSIKPGSMADRARMAKLPQPEIALKCPRCDSTNTKFCYFNNYSLSQPRHFCKTCRRYWTRGGALRNVPVGGGCRRNNKRSNKSSNPSKSPVKTGSGSTSSIPSNSGTTSDMIGHMQHQQQPSSQLPNFMASLQHHLTDHHHYGAADQMGFNFGGIFHHPAGAPTADHIEFNMVSNNSSGGGGGISLSSRGSEQWRLQQLQQFPFLAGLEPPPGLYPFDGEAGGEPPTAYVGGGGSTTTGQNIRAKPSSNIPNSSVAINNNGVPSSVKMEENNHHHQQGMNISRQFLGIPGNDHHQYLGNASNAWTDLSGFTSSSSSHLLS